MSSEAYLVVRGSGAGPLFRFSDGRPLTRARFVEQVKKALMEAGVDSSPYSGHTKILQIARRFVSAILRNPGGIRKTYCARSRNDVRSLTSRSSGMPEAE